MPAGPLGGLAGGARVLAAAGRRLVEQERVHLAVGGRVVAVAHARERALHAPRDLLHVAFVVAHDAQRAAAGADEDVPAVADRPDVAVHGAEEQALLLGVLHRDEPLRHPRTS